MGTESWLSTLLWSSRKATPENDKAVIGVLAFEVASLLSKVANLWHFLRENEILRLREEIASSVGIQKLVADDVDYVMDLVLNEIMENFVFIARSVGRLGRKCVDPPFRCFEHFVNDPVENSFQWCGWEYRLKKMERKVKKMERFVQVTMQLAQEQEVLVELEQTFRRKRSNPDLRRGKLLEFQQKVTRQRQEVRFLREMSPWVRTYDYIVRLLARSLLTVLQRIMHVFGISQLPSADESNNLELTNPTCLPRSRSFSILMQSSVHPSENMFCGIPPAPILSGKHLHLKTNLLAHCETFSERMMNERESAIVQVGKSAPCHSKKYTCHDMKNGYKMENLSFRSFDCSNRIYSKLAHFSSKRGLLDAPSSTLGHFGLALHYANVIVFIEKLSTSPHMIDSEARDELYSMLPTTIRKALRAKLKVSGKFQTPSAYEASLAAEWIRALMKILEWLSPLAHNMIRWHFERSFEREHEFCSTNVLLVQTLHHANREKTEAAITELLVGLSYICRNNRDPDEIARTKSSRHRVGFSHLLKRERDCMNVV